MYTSTYFPLNDNYYNLEFPFKICKKINCRIIYNVLYRNKIYLTYSNSVIITTLENPAAFIKPSDRDMK